MGCSEHLTQQVAKHVCVHMFGEDIVCDRMALARSLAVTAGPFQRGYLRGQALLKQGRCQACDRQIKALNSGDGRRWEILAKLDPPAPCRVAQ